MDTHNDLPTTGEVRDRLVEHSTDQQTEDRRRATLFATANIGLALVFGVIGVWLTISGLRYGVGSDGRIGSGLFPLIVGILICILSVAWLVQKDLRTLPEAQDESEDSDSQLPDRHGLISMAVTMVACFVFVGVLPSLGFKLAMSLLVLTLLKVVAGRSWWSAVLMAFVFGFGSFYLFVDLLDVALPISNVLLLQGWGL